MQDAGASIGTRREAGVLLGNLGWQPDDLDAFVEIPAGEFLYGDSQEARRIAHPYGIGQYPVTNAQYARFVAAGGYENRDYWSMEGWAWRTGTYDRKAPQVYQDRLSQRPPEKRDRPFFWTLEKWNNPLFPVVGVTYFEAEAYCTWLAMTTGKAYRLPTEEEWERAARGVAGQVYPWGEAFEGARLNCADAWAGRDLSDFDVWSEWWDQKPEYVGTTAVCTYPQGASPAGVWDLSGNVWEWTGSAWDGEHKVLRGGSWDGYRRDARCAYRVRNVPVSFNDDFGFRLVVSLVRG